jgi:hypothetical protein
MGSSSLKSYQRITTLFVALWFFLNPGSAAAQTAAFTYQGRLVDGGTAANGNYDLQFALWDSISGGSQIGPTQVISNVGVSSGIFSVTLDFGSGAFPGADRFLEISARQSGASAFILLTPRQQITSTPYAVRSGNATNADTATNATQLGGIAASQYAQATDSRLTDSRSPTGGSSNYIQNGTNQQSNSNFSISGDGAAGGALSANVVNAATQFSLGGNGVLSIAGFNNIFVGALAGRGGFRNSFFGQAAGQFNSGNNNAFFGVQAGLNTSGNSNSFFGSSAGSGNTAGTLNSFFGSSVGASNTTGGQNAFFGANAGAGKYDRQQQHLRWRLPDGQ